MSRRYWQLLPKAVVVVWLVSLLLASVALLWSGLIARSNLLAAKNSWDGKTVGQLDRAAGSLSRAASLCSFGISMPASQTLKFVPFTRKYLLATEAACGIGTDVARAVRTKEVQTFLSHLSSKEDFRQWLQDPQLPTLAAAASKSSEKELLRASQGLEKLDSLKLPGSLGNRISRASKSFSPNRVESISSLLAVAPDLLGAERPKRYFVGLLSDAEMRAGGNGFLGQFAILSLSKGRAQIERFGANTALPAMSEQNHATLAGTEELMGTNNPEWVNVNLSPHGPDVGASVFRGWKLGTGEVIDGYLSLDVLTAARLAERLGKSLTTYKGSVLTIAEEMADYAQNGIYFDFPSPREAGEPRKVFQVGLLRELLNSVAASFVEPKALLSVLPRGIEENRVLLWFSDPKVQSQIAKSQIAQNIEANPTQVAVHFNNGSGNKFDHYLHLSGEVTCARSGEKVLTLKVASSAKADVKYPLYIGQRLDQPSQRRASTFNQYLIEIPMGSNLRLATLDGEIVDARLVMVGKRPIVEVPFEIFAGQSRVLKVTFVGNVTSLSLPGQAPRSFICKN